MYNNINEINPIELRSRNETNDSGIKLNGNTLETVDEYEYLGCAYYNK